MVRKNLLFVFLILLVAVSAVSAYQFSPLEQVFQPTGAESQKNYTIVNDSDDQIAIELAVYIRDQDAEGNEIRKKSTSEFRILPTDKIIMQPQSTQIITVKYVGSQTVTVEKSYRLVASQLTYSQGKNQTSQSMFNFLYVYATSLYVVPSESRADVRLATVKAVTGEDGKQLMELSFQNRGNVHQILRELNLTVKDQKGNTVTLTGAEQLPGVDSMNILARKNLKKTIPWPEGIPFDAAGTYTGTIEYTN
ncbi:MAG: molecular chaperone [Spirochaetales bacterium]|jgi:fimbrial chaperone protein|nr:molecular chaperone [Spirochaetales bacterium]